MNIIISKRTIGQAEINSVSSRELHKELEIKKKYPDWIKTQISRLHLRANYHYIVNEEVIPLEGINPKTKGGRPSFDYIITLDTAKNISLISLSKKGADIRDYFIECEKKLTEIRPISYEQTMLNALRLADDKVKEQQLLIQAKEKSLKAKDEIILTVADLNIKAGEVSISDFAKNLAIKGMGRNNMYIWLRNNGYLMSNNEPFQIYVERGIFKRKPYKEQIQGETKYSTVLTPRGTIEIANKIKGSVC